MNRLTSICLLSLIPHLAFAKEPSSLSWKGAKEVHKGSIIQDTPPAYRVKMVNGLTLLILQDKRNTLASFRLILNAGSNQEVKGKSGLAHFFEHMMFRKTKSNPEGHFDRTLAGIGGTGNAGTSTDFVEYESTFPSPAMDIILDIEHKRFTQLDLMDPYFSTEKGAVLSERKLRYENDPSRRASESLRHLIEKGTPYEWMVIGEKGDIESMQIADAQSFYDILYRPDNAILAIGSPLDPKVVFDKVNATFGKWQGKSKVTPVNVSPQHYSSHFGKSLVCSEAVTQHMMTITYPTTTASYQDSIYSWVYSQLLDDHPDGTVARQMQKKGIGSNFGFYLDNYQKNNPRYQAVFIFGLEDQVGPVQDFWVKTQNYMNTVEINKQTIKNLLKKVEVNESEEAERMTSLIRSYEWNEFLYGDFLASKSTNDIVSKINTKTFRNWVTQKLNPKLSYTTAVVNPKLAKPCQELK